MADPFIGEIRAAGFNFPPPGWALCNGQSLPIDQYATLFNLIGTTYGGDGVQSFSLPNLNGRMAVDAGNGPGLSPYYAGQAAGSESVTLNSAQLPAHNHTIAAQNGTGGQASPSGNFFSASSLAQFGPSGTLLTAPLLTSMGGNQPHENRMPSLAVNYIIALFGVYPSQG